MRFLDKLTEKIISKVSDWLLVEDAPSRAYLSNFPQICEEIRPADVLLIEGRSRAGQIIKRVTQSSWSHAVMYLGRYYEVMESLSDPVLMDLLARHYKGSPLAQVVIETEIGLGAIVSPLDKYKSDHVRILRARMLSKEDTQKVLQYAIGRLGKRYDLRHLLDMARFMFPWGLYPRKWRSSLFQHNAQQPTEDICTSLIAYAFKSIDYPILPLVRENLEEELELIERNPKLFTPSDFDYSPYFDVIKYPIFPLTSEGARQKLHWKKGVVSNGKDEFSFIESEN